MLRIVLSNSLKSLALIVLLAIGRNVNAQIANEIVSEKTGNISFETPDIIGLWKVDQVTVGDQNLTPTAKWFLFENNGNMTSGNGWVQNSLGNWTYYEAQLTLLQTTPQQTDEFGAFQVAFEGKNMIWQRMEEGEKVIVTLSSTNEKPLAPWDEIVGVWELQGMETLNNKTSSGAIADVEPQSYFFRWDRRFVEMNAAGERTDTGIWHIEAHSPTLTMFFDSNTSKQVWAIEIMGNQMILKGTEGDITTTLSFEKK